MLTPALSRVKFYVDDQTPATTTNGTIPATILSCSATLKVGEFGGVLPRNWNGDIGEIALYDSALSDADREAVRDYLNNRWATY